MTEPTATVLPETVLPGHRLGRHLEHDPASRNYEATPPPVKLISKRWTRRSPILNQDIGSCVGETFAGWLATDTADRTGRTDVDQALALTIYEEATKLDRVPGHYPPDDTGSTGLAGAKALVRMGLATGPYRHTFTPAAALAWLSHKGPLAVGIAWVTGLDHPDRNGIAQYTGAVRGGHEQLWDEIDVERRLVWSSNSWGPDWGIDGRFALSFDGFGRALAAQGDVIVLAH